MRELFKYFDFYLRMTRGGILVFFALVLVSVFFQMLSAAALLAVLETFKPERQLNMLTKIIFFAVDTMNFSNPNHLLAFLLILASLAFMLSSAAQIAFTVHMTKLQADILVKIQPEAAEKLLLSDYQFFLSQNSGYLNNLIVQQISQVAQSFKFYATIVTSVLFAFLYVVIPFIMQPEMALTMTILGLPFILVIKVINRRTKRLSQESVVEYTDLFSLLIQSIGNFKYLKSTRTFQPVMEKIRFRSRRLGKNMEHLAFWGALSSFAITPFAVMFICALIYWQVAVMGKPILDAVTILALLYAASQRLITVPNSYQKFLGAFGSIDSYESLMKGLEDNREIVKTEGAKKPDFSGPIKLEDVQFRYKTGGDDVLRGLSLEIRPNTSVAFVGGSGAGKSTVINMLTGLLRPTSGRLSLSGADYSDLDLFELRRHVGYVTQEPVVFNDTVRNNITLWDGSADEKAVSAAASQAHADAFIRQMPEGYESMLGDNGINISGGQRQRISIARELFRDARLLILDEATSSLDSETERLIQQSIDEFSGKKTVVIIAHRLSTIKNCDQICVLEGGRLVEQGSYEELYKAGGVFKCMVDRQSLAEK